GSRDRAVAIVDFKNIKNKKSVAKEILSQNKSVKTVIDKGSPRKGEFRLRDYKIIAGDKNTKVIHKESGCRFLLNPRRVYFSPREGTERMRIAKLVKPDETVMIFFAGAGSFAIVMGKHTEAKKIVGIEINPKACEYFRKNIEINKLQNVEVMQGDVGRVAAKYYDKCDRVIMPLPETSIEFLDEAIKCLGKSGTCHLYCFLKDDGIRKMKARIKKRIDPYSRDVKFTNIQRVLPYGPGIYKYRIDFVIS
ncbi:MAG: methyltransferase domain-containing protein, partial [Candidatus Aenigmatarchaeota archaeon]